MELAQRRQLEAFKSSIPSLQVAASFACSVASLSRSPAFQLPGHHHLHGEVLADHQFDWGGLSTCTAARVQCLLTPSPSQNLQESPPSKNIGFESCVACRCAVNMGSRLSPTLTPPPAACLLHHVTHQAASFPPSSQFLMEALRVSYFFSS